MDFVVFMLISVTDYYSVFLFMFSLFRFNMDIQYHKRIFLAALICSALSFTIDGPLANYAPMIQLLVLVICTWGLFRIALPYALLMVVSSWIGYGVTQMLIILAYRYNLEQVGTTDSGGYSLEGGIVAISTNVLFVLLAFLIRKRNLGFDFVPQHKRRGLRDYAGFNILLLISSLIAVSASAMAYYIADHGTGYYILLGLLTGILVTQTLLMMIKDDLE